MSTLTRSGKTHPKCWHQLVGKLVSACICLHTPSIYFLKLLQKYYQHTYLGTLDISGHFRQKRYYKLVETLMDVCRNLYLHVCACIYFINIFFLSYCKNITNILNWVLEHIWALPSKTILQTCRNFDVYLHAKNELHHFFFEIL